MKEFLKRLFKEKKILILGYGREGQSSYKLIREYFPSLQLVIADKRKDVAGYLSPKDKFLLFHLGEDYLEGLDTYDLIVKTPGISLQELPDLMLTGKITSQTDLFLRAYANQVIGVTGTKGKSTTTSLIYHMLTSSGRKAVLVGNIGIPPFEILHQLDKSTIIVFELSSHQLEFITRAPHIGILLNLFQEHLDHYSSLNAYHQAKWNIAAAQNEDDYFIYNAENPAIQSWLKRAKPRSNLLPFSLNVKFNQGIMVNDDDYVFVNYQDKIRDLFHKGIPRNIPGDHNLMNIMAAATACSLAGLKEQELSEGISSFEGLPHRIEYVGIYDGVRYYNDSIATIPEATIEAVRTLHDVDTLILGGFDRGIDYSALVQYLSNSTVSNIIFTGGAGNRIFTEFQGINHGLNLYFAHDYNEVLKIARKYTVKGKICLLSPAAASYDNFRNFEERGEVFKKIVKG